MMCACLRCKLPNFSYKHMTNPNCTRTHVPASRVQVSLGYKFTNPYPNPNQTCELTPGYSLPMPFPRWHQVHSIYIDLWKVRGGCCNYWRNQDLLCFTKLTKSACVYKPCYVMRHHWPPIVIAEQRVCCIKSSMTDIIVCRQYQKQLAVLRNNNLVLSLGILSP